MTDHATPVSETNAARLRELNATIRYTMWSVFRATAPLRDHELKSLVDGVSRPSDHDRCQELAGEVEDLFEQLAAKDVVVRGTYDVTALRADADLMVWWHASSADALQEAYAL